MKKKLLAILLLLIFVAPVTITYIWIQYQKAVVKHEVKWRMIEGIDKSELVLLKFTEQESKIKLNWKHSKEFEYKNEMYDVVEFETIGDTTYYWCWFDDKETDLNQQLSELVKNTFNNSPQKKDQLAILINYFKVQYCQTNFSCQSISPKFIKIKYSILHEFYSSLKLAPPTPPPQFV